MEVKTYSGGHFLKACNSIMFWIVNNEVFIEANWKGLKVEVYETLDAFNEEISIFSEDMNPEENVPDEEEKYALEEERIAQLIKDFLVIRMKVRDRRKEYPGIAYYYDRTQDYINEWCDSCIGEVQIKNRFQKQMCPECNEPIYPCSMCNLDNVDCSNCVLSEE